MSSTRFSGYISSTPWEKRKTHSSSQKITQTTSSKSKRKSEKDEESLDQSIEIVEDVVEPSDREKSKMKGKNMVFTPPVSEMVKTRRPMTRSATK